MLVIIAGAVGTASTAGTLRCGYNANSCDDRQRLRSGSPPWPGRRSPLSWRCRESAPYRSLFSIVGTTDLHGNIFGGAGRGGLELLGGYLDNLHAARAADGGAVVLIDAGDTYQAGIESDLSEGAVVVDAYNALGYTAAAIGNHEFDFGAVEDRARARYSARIRAARFRRSPRARSFRFSRRT